uniref:Putative PD-(D/E)XK nuclease superfamily protein n=1 Tax=viral metagenome TaxID=1070528 RepID=A0A6M3LBI6_9ZZZZ
MNLRDQPTSFDNTILSTFASCQRKFYLFWLGLEHKETPAYFTFGRVWQQALEKWYTTKGEQAYRLTEAMELAERQWQDAGSPSGTRDNIENLKFMLMLYAIEYEEEDWEIILHDGKMELGFEFPLQGTPWTLSGAIDGYVEWPRYGKLVLECKTSGVSLTDSYMAQWGFSSQVTQYYWGLTQLLGEAPFGVLMNCAWKGVSEKAKLAFKKNLDIPEGMFARNLEKRSEFKIAEFEATTKLLIEDILRQFGKMLWPKTKNVIECTGGIGKSPCQFKRICLADAFPWDMSDEQLLGNDLRLRDGLWEPWKRGTKE